MSKAQETKDAELLALAALVFQDGVLMAGENMLRHLQGNAPAYLPGNEWENYLRLYQELERRRTEEKP